MPPGRPPKPVRFARHKIVPLTRLRTGKLTLPSAPKVKGKPGRRTDHYVSVKPTLKWKPPVVPPRTNLSITTRSKNEKGDRSSPATSSLLLGALALLPNEALANQQTEAITETPEIPWYVEYEIPIFFTMAVILALEILLIARQEINRRQLRRPRPKNIGRPYRRSEPAQMVKISPPFTIPPTELEVAMDETGLDEEDVYLLATKMDTLLLSDINGRERYARFFTHLIRSKSEPLVALGRWMEKRIFTDGSPPRDILARHRLIGTAEILPLEAFIRRIRIGRENISAGRGDSDIPRDWDLKKQYLFRSHALTPYARLELSKKPSNGITQAIFKTDSFLPETTVVFEGTKYHLSHLLIDGTSYQYRIIMAERDGRLRPFFAYRSGSGGGWRTSNYALGYWMSKGSTRLYTAESEPFAELLTEFEVMEDMPARYVPKDSVRKLFDIAQKNMGEDLPQGSTPYDRVLSPDAAKEANHALASAEKMVGSKDRQRPEGIGIAKDARPHFERNPQRIVRHFHQYLGDSLRLQYESTRNGRPVRWNVYIKNRPSISRIKDIRFMRALEIDDDHFVIVEETSIPPEVYDEGLREITQFQPGMMFRSSLPPSIPQLNRSLLSVPEEFLPDLSVRPDEIGAYRHSLLGQCVRARYLGKLAGETAIWDFIVRRSDGLAWIKPVRFRDARRTEDGKQARVIDSGFLSSKPLEYRSQLEGVIADPTLRRFIIPFESPDGKTTYGDIRPLLAQLNIMREFYNSTWYREHFGIMRW